MIEKTWDPLDDESSDKEILFVAKKREIRNILKSYVGMYDSFSELIQNAMDAVDRRKRDLNEPTYERKLWLTINLQENSFTIVDNGIGLKEKEFKSFLAPNISFKERNMRGNKGVGATYIAYGFNYLQFGTKGYGHSFIGEMTDGREWVDDEQGIITRPQVIESISNDLNFQQIDRGSIFKIKFDMKSRPKNLTWFTANTPEQWLYLFLIKTPLGSLSFSAKQDPIKFDLTVINKIGEQNTITNQEAKYIFPHEPISASVNLKDVNALQKKFNEEGRGSKSLPKKFYKSNGLYEFFSTEEIARFRNLEEKEKEILKIYSVEAYGYFAYSTSIWDQLNDNRANLRKGYRVLSGGLQLANNQMVQGELILIPLTSNTGYQNQCHIIVHFQNADPDLGRKGFQPELKEFAEKVAVAIVNRFKGWRELLKSDSGAKTDITKEIKLNDWIKLQEKHEEESPLIIKNPNFFAPVHEISITSIPQSEQDVIVLFNQLISGGVIRGIKLMATSQFEQYDGLFRFMIKKLSDNHIFHREKNPLGIELYKYTEDLISHPMVLEYKHNLNGLINEFENGEKNEKDIDLVITWEIGDIWLKNYSITSLLNLDNLHHRDFHGLTHILHSNTNRLYIIALKDLVDYLNDIDSSQDYQKKTYSDDF